MNNEPEIAKLIGLMAAAYPNTQIADATVEVYVTMLRDIPLELLTLSVQQCMAESEFLPTVAKLRTKAIQLSKPQHVSSLEAWGCVRKEIERTGFYRSPVFADPLIARAVDCIGWQSLCSSENEPADRAHFARVYESLVQREEEDAKTLPLIREMRDQTKLLIEARSIQ